MTEQLGVKAYVRYMDDLFLWHDDKTKLMAIEKCLRHYASEELQLSLKPMILSRSLNGVPFLGYVITPGQIKLSQRSRNRFIEKFRRYQEKIARGEWSQLEFQNHILPLLSFTDYAFARPFRKKVIDKIGDSVHC